MIKVNYDSQTTLVKGYYPNSINYASIPEPFIEIEDSEQNSNKDMCVIDGIYQEYIKPDSVLLQEAKDLKRAETKTYLNTMFANPLLVRAGNGGGKPDYYVKPSPEYNIFLAGFSMADGETKDWRAFDIDCNKLSNSDGSPLFLQLTKDELITISSHYEDRKTQEYNQRDLKLAAINALTTVVAVEAFDVSEVIV